MAVIVPSNHLPNVRSVSLVAKHSQTSKFRLKNAALTDLMVIFYLLLASPEASEELFASKHIYHK